MSTSATGGYILPDPNFPVLPGGLSLKQFLQTVFVGVSGLPGDLVRPRWQLNPPKSPDANINWMAIGLAKSKADANAYTGESLGASATGFIKLTCNPKPGGTVTVNGVLITFVFADPTGSEVLIGATPTETVQNLATFLTASTDPDLILATYSAFYHQVSITAVEIGVSGNDFTLEAASSAIELSGATLSNGGVFNNQTQRHEDLEIQCAFYGPNSDDFGALVRDSLQIQQNLESLRSANMGFVEASELMHVPDLLNERWVDRYEMSVFLRREIQRVYPVLSFVSVGGNILSVVSGELKTIAWQTSV